MTKLEKFLYNRELLEAFERNCRYRGADYITFLPIYDVHINAIDRAFNWSTTPEGDRFWYKLSMEWKECLETNTL